METNVVIIQTNKILNKRSEIRKVRKNRSRANFVTTRPKRNKNNVKRPRRNKKMFTLVMRSLNVRLP